jgi:antitoxin MazE
LVVIPSGSEESRLEARFLAAARNDTEVVDSAQSLRLRGLIGLTWSQEWECRKLRISMPKLKSNLEESVGVGAKHQVTIPRRISKAPHLKKWDHMLVRLVDHRIEMIPASLIPKDQLWFWTPGWQKKEREADKDIAHGSVKEFDSVEELLNDLRS